MYMNIFIQWLGRGRVFFHLKAKDILSYFETIMVTYKHEYGLIHDSDCS